ncbi:MAG TPA: hypothetical protein VFT88_05150 [Acidobacteriaceae bacterium]|nr:hypothetical protein [Acidobacteriaceae bacterium]
MMQYTHFRFDEKASVEKLLADLLDRNVQFAVALDPQDLNAPIHFGWVVSYPAPLEAAESAVA